MEYKEMQTKTTHETEKEKERDERTHVFSRL